MAESLYVRFLYETVPGRVILKILTKPVISQAAGQILDSRASRYLIPAFVRKNNIDTWDLIVPEGGFPSFNAFFSRERENDEIRIGQGGIICPCDGFLSLIQIKEQVMFNVKHTKFSLGGLLMDKKAAELFRDGYALIFRLTPSHYHRYLHAANGKIKFQKSINGILHCVRPLATEKFPVYIQNTRKYQIIRTKKYGYILQMELGAMLVGRIQNHPLYDRNVKAGQEKGFFEYGGSTILLLLQKDKVKLKDWVYKAENGEISVRQGTVLAE